MAQGSSSELRIQDLGSKGPKGEGSKSPGSARHDDGGVVSSKHEPKCR